MSLKLVQIATVPVRIDISIPPEKPVISGFITGEAVIRSKKELAQLAEEIAEGKYATDEELLKPGILYTSLDGMVSSEGKELTGQDAFDEVTNGKYGAYLTPSCIQKYFKHFQEAQVKNSRPSRGR